MSVKTDERRIKLFVHVSSDLTKVVGYSLSVPIKTVKLRGECEGVFEGDILCKWVEVPYRGVLPSSLSLKGYSPGLNLPCVFGPGTFTQSLETKIESLLSDGVLPHPIDLSLWEVKVEVGGSSHSVEDSRVLSDTEVGPSHDCGWFLRSKVSFPYTIDFVLVDSSLLKGMKVTSTFDPIYWKVADTVKSEFVSLVNRGTLLKFVGRDYLSTMGYLGCVVTNTTVVFREVEMTARGINLLSVNGKRLPLLVEDGHVERSWELTNEIPISPKVRDEIWVLVKGVGESICLVESLTQRSTFIIVFLTTTDVGEKERKVVSSFKDEVNVYLKLVESPSPP